MTNLIENIQVSRLQVDFKILMIFDDQFLFFEKGFDSDISLSFLRNRKVKCQIHLVQYLIFTFSCARLNFYFLRYTNQKSIPLPQIRPMV